MARDLEQYRRFSEESKKCIDQQINEASQLNASFVSLQEQVAELRKHYEFTISGLKEENKRLQEALSHYTTTTTGLGQFASQAATAAAAAASASIPSSIVSDVSVSSQPSQPPQPPSLAVVPDLVEEVKKDGWTFGYSSAEQAAASDRLSVELSSILQHDDAVCDAVFSPDGTYLATSSLMSVRVFEWKTQTLVHTFTVGSSEASKNYVRCIRYSPDGKMIAAGADDGFIRIWNLEDKSLVQEWSAHTSSLVSVSFSPDGKVLISAGQDATVVLWDVNTLRKILTICETPNAPSSGTVPALSPDGSLLAVSWTDGFLRLYKLPSEKAVATYRCPQEKVNSICFSPDGTSVAVASLDNSVMIYDVTRPDSVPRPVNAGHTNLALCVAFSPDGRWIVSGSKDKTVRFSRVNPLGLSAVLCGHLNSILKVAFAPVLKKARKEDEKDMKDEDGKNDDVVDGDDDMYLATGSGDQTVKVWRIKQTKEKNGEGEAKQQEEGKAKVEETA